MAETGGTSDSIAVFAGPSPKIRRIGMDRPWTWLASGWQDLRRAPAVGLSYGVIFSAAGLALTAAIWLLDVFYLVLPLGAGFMLMGPILAVGLYEVSRRLGAGEPVGFGLALTAWRRNPAQIALMGLLLMLFLLAWIRVATLVFALFFSQNPPDPNNFIADVFFSGESIPFVVVGTTLGAILAALVFALSAVSIPMLLDRDVRLGVAVSTSLRVVAANPVPLAAWGLIVAGALLLGSIPLFLGLIIVMPVLGHATWHLYRKAVAR